MGEDARSVVEYRQLFEEMVSGFALHEMICDPGGRPVDYRFLDVNPAFERLTGLKREVVVGRTVREIIPKIEDHWIETYGRVALEGRPTRFEAKAEGLGKWFEVTAFSPRRGQFAATFTDITTRVATKIHLDRFFETSIDLMCIAGKDGYLRRLNGRWSELLGWTIEELMSRPFFDFIHPDDQASSTKAVERLEEEPVYGFVCRFRCRDGSLRAIEWSALSDGDTLYATGRDVTESDKHRRELERSNAELQHFAYVASHDLQEPLRMISSYLRLLEKRYGETFDEAATEFIGFAIDGAKRMSVLINDLLAFSRVETRGEAFQRLKLGEAVDSALVNLRSVLDDTRADVDIAALGEVEGDRAQLISLFQNLIGNALKYHQPGRKPQIRVARDKRDGATVYRVTDNGIGIEERYFEQIFVIFKRLHPRDAYEGTGIGLAVCKRIIERHGGRLWVESRPGVGSTFYFTLGERPFRGFQP